MKLEKVNGLRILHPDKHKVLANKEKTWFAEKDIYLGGLDKESDFVEVTPEERDRILKELEEKQKLEESQQNRV